MALDIFRHGTSPWEEVVEVVEEEEEGGDEFDVDDDDDDDDHRRAKGSKATTAAAATATAKDKATGRRKKYGGSLSPNAYTFGAILACAARDGDVGTSMRILRTLEGGARYPDVTLNHVLYSTVISACANHCAAAVSSRDDDREGGGGVPAAGRIGDDDIVELALEVLNRGIRTLGGGGMGVVGYNAVISTMAKAGRWKMAVQFLGEMILHSSSSPSSTTTTTTAVLPPPSSNPPSPVRIGEEGTSSSSSSRSPPSPSLRRTNPNFGPMEIIRDDISSAPLLLHQGSSSPPSDDEDGENIRGDYRDDIIVTPRPDGVTFGTVLSACERSSQWNTALDVARAATEYGVGLDGMALTSILHSCQQLGLAGECVRRDILGAI